MKPANVRQFKGSFFKVLQQTPLSQVAVMTIGPGEDSGPEEIHEGDQIVYVIEGEAEAEIDKQKFRLTEGMIVTIPARTQHHIYNSGSKDLFFLTIYAPPAY